MILNFAINIEAERGHSTQSFIKMKVVVGALFLAGFIASGGNGQQILSNDGGCKGDGCASFRNSH